ncbi:LysM peptidoglycan-binding domain-containing protein [Halalkalibacter akibai]|uniref:Cell wall-binding protein n=1 Tax=Halalkalibacter akibai (strain ATCC 43226 / DSM 21942 / CIP 109018 / JCM 9157 / 1139) TaxID=1236973 RepID=W4QSD6_HALA3|nr:LysM peptidoglycan-binding domain-containing protein [Halalkalibacter akibai]GAE34842.1 cell wall-binding protein [Halalkalibacter akibai JCM 9157]
MKKSIVSLATVATLLGTLSFGLHASAAEVTIQKGDTLSAIASKHSISVDTLKEWNNLSSHLIYPGDRLKVELVEQYEVQKGETLSDISMKFNNINWKQIQEWNNIKDASLIFEGQILDIYLEHSSKASLNQETVTTSEKQKAERIVEKPVEMAATKEQTQEPEVKVDKPVKEETSTEDVAMELTMSATAYTASCNGCSGITATGLNLLDNPDKKVISVDPSVIPLGSKVYVEGYGHAIAGDTGGAIVGNKIDLFIPEKQDAINWGVRDVKVTVYK